MQFTKSCQPSNPRQPACVANPLCVLCGEKTWSFPIILPPVPDQAALTLHFIPRPSQQARLRMREFHFLFPVPLAVESDHGLLDVAGSQNAVHHLHHLALVLVLSFERNFP